jgi:RecB family exonuclease
MTPGILSGRIPLAVLKRLSPSRFQSLKDCALRQVWTAQGELGQLPATPAARLGSAIHRLLEEAGKGMFRETGGVAVEQRWGELEADAESAMRNSWLERHLVPLKSAVPDYEVRTLRALQRAREITLALPAEAAHPRGRQHQGRELWVATPDGFIGGYIDQVDPTPDGPVLRDYKSGQILEGPPARGDGRAKLQYEVQLKLYAALYQSTTGVWPVRLELVSLQGPAHEVAFTPYACQELLRQAREAVLKINAMITDNPPEVAEAMLASPSPGSCRYCLFRPSCAAYRDARERGCPEDGWPEDVWGIVGEKRALGNGKLLLSIQTGSAGATLAVIRGLSASPGRHPALPSLSPGDVVCAFGLKGEARGGTFQESMWTVLYRTGCCSQDGQVAQDS